MEIRVLGPFEVVADGDPVPLGGVRQRSVLALLVLHAGEVLSGDRIIDALWGEHAPGDAAAALQAHVSRLRRALAPHALIETRAGGYVVALEPGQLDAERFATLVERSREEPPEVAAETLREALALFRGRPLADLAGEPWAAGAARELEDARLDALELRIDADLALARDMITELAGHVREHPLRERLRAQHMLALYRSGRQAEALDAFTRARAEIVEALGIEPGPELRRLQQQILEQDPELERRRPLPTLPPRRRWLAAAAVAALAAVPGVLLLTGGDEIPAGPRSDGQLAVLNARTGVVERRIDVGATPQAVAVAGGAAWIVDADEQLVRRVDRGTGAVASFSTGATPADVAARGAEVWVLESRRSGRAQVAGPRPATVARVDARARTVRGRVDLPAGGETVSRTSDDHVAVGAGSIWAVGAGGTVVRVDPRSQAVVATIDGFEATSVAAGDDGVWLLGENGTVASVDVRRNRVGKRGRIETAAAGAIAAGAGSAWVTSPGDGAVWRIKDGPKLVTKRIAVGAGAGDAAFGAGALWVTNPVRGTVSRIDPATDRAGVPVAVGGVPRGIAVDGDGPVVTIDGTLPSAATLAGGVPAEGCGPVIARGRPDRLIVADLPLQGGLQLSTQQMALAAEYVLRGRAFRAGAHSLGLQVCDHSVARTGLFDEAKCAANARAYVSTPAVIGVVGPVNTPCAAASLAITNRADLAVISPSASSPQLTHDRALHPTGRRNFTRTAPPDDRQAVAAAQLAKNLGARRVAIASDGIDYGHFMAQTFHAEARRLGLEVERVRWRAPQFSMPPDAVFLGGLLDTGGARVVRAVRRALGPRVPILVTDGFTPTPLLAERAGAGVRNTYLAINGLIPESYPPAGRRFAREFGASLPGVEIEPTALYTAAAMQTLLDAVAASDGTRDSVRRKLLTARSKTVVGRVSFDASGDPHGTGVTILRMEPGRTAGPFEDAVLDRVVAAG